MIELREVRRRFGDVRAVDGLSLTVKPGEVFGLIGPNGAGKSTTIRMIVNVLAPDTGAVLFDGRPIRRRDRDSFGYLPQERGLYRTVKVGEMLAYLASLKRADGERTRRRINGWLERFDLAEWKNRRCEDLPKVMAQRVQFIAAVAHDPSHVFLDEPFAGLDPASTDLLREAIVELGRQGRAVLLATDAMGVAERLCSRVCLIDRGRQVVAGTMEEVKTRYGKNAVIAELDGDIDQAGLGGLVRAVTRYPRHVEIELARGASAQELLKVLAARVTVRRFEVASPSLARIFVQLAGGGKSGE